MRPLAMDCGAHNGDDTAYYVAKGFRVVAVEANPVMVDHLRLRFDREIATGQVVVRHLLLCGRYMPTPRFHQHKHHSVLSSAYADSSDDWHPPIDVPGKTLVELMQEHGVPHFCKIDCEHMDRYLLSDLYASDLRPFSLSVEIHDPCAAGMALALDYREAAVVDGHDVGSRYRHHVIQTDAGPTTWSFNDHASGPCLDDLPHWTTPADLLGRGIVSGWRDLHLRHPRV